MQTPATCPQGQMCGKPHPWLEQILSDLDALAERSNLSDAMDEIRSKPVLLFCDEAIREAAGQKVQMTLQLDELQAEVKRLRAELAKYAPRDD